MNYRGMFAMHVDDEDKNLNDKTGATLKKWTTKRRGGIIE